MPTDDEHKDFLEKGEPTDEQDHGKQTTKVNDLITHHEGLKNAASGKEKTKQQGIIDRLRTKKNNLKKWAETWNKGGNRQKRKKNFLDSESDDDAAAGGTVAT